jgi:murein DD-endopeptidase MepM/ murein hydrolase activator NlpD
MDERRLTLIVVPHGDLETRTYEISYRKLKLLLILAFVMLAAFIVMASTWWYVGAQAARVNGLVQEVRRLEEEREKVAELARTLSEVEAQYERVRQLLGADAAPARGMEPLLPPLRDEPSPREEKDDISAFPAAWPLARPGYITREVTREDDRAHPGLDIAVPHDTYIRAAGSGVVRAAGTDDVYGRYVLIDHGNGYETMYGHASRLFVAAGDPVERNEVIALSGSTGRSTAPHLHFEVRKDGSPIDPLPMIRKP